MDYNQSTVVKGVQGSYDKHITRWKAHNAERERCPFCRLMIHPTTKAKHMRISHGGL